MKAEAPYFSIVIPTYNRAHLIDKTINSVLAQTFQSFEVIIIDDGSSDNTAEVVQKFQDSRVQFYRKQNGERGAARNFGASKACGRYVNFFDSDDLMYGNHLEVAKFFIEQKQGPEIVHLGYDFKNPDGNVTRRVDRLGDNLAGIVMFDNILSCNGVFVRKDIVEANPFSEDREMSSAEDWELWIRLIARYPLYHSNEVTSSVVDHDLRSIFTISPNKVIRRDLIMIEKLQQDEGVLRLYGKAMEKFKAFRFSFFMLCLAEHGRRRETLRWAGAAFSVFPMIIFTKRYIASIKKALLR